MFTVTLVYRDKNGETKILHWENILDDFTMRFVLEELTISDIHMRDVIRVREG